MKEKLSYLKIFILYLDLKEKKFYSIGKSKTRWTKCLKDSSWGSLLRV
jgi:hypothetical protein